MSTIKNTHQLRKGDRIAMHGGVFLITTDARESCAHRPHDNIGPSDVIAFSSICESGNVPNYFWPGSSWMVQGNRLARWSVI